MKSLKVIKIVKEIKFKEVWANLKSKYCFQRSQFIKYLRLTLVFMRDSY